VSAPRRVLVTGAAGFVGRHLVALLRQEQPGIDLYGTVRPGGTPAADLPAGVNAVGADLLDPGAVEDAVARAAPEAVFHLAAQSSPARSWEDPAGTLATNVLGVTHLLEGLKRRRLAPRVLVVGSAEEYGAAAASELPLSEDAPLRPASPYAASKVAQSFVALQYHLAHGLPVVRTRTFPHTGPGRGAAFAESSFARQLAEIEAGRRAPVIEVGNLDAVRDFTDVRDVVRAYWALLLAGRPGEVYNVASGSGTRVGAVLDRLIALSGRRVEVRVDPARLRPADVPALVGDPARLKAATGWEPRLTLERSLADLLDDWRRRVASPAAAEAR
jgi:GDP-4-dehydro-6-deoxy-D-mannose reductase